MFAVIFEFKYIFTYSALIIKWCGYSVKIHIAQAMTFVPSETACTAYRQVHLFIKRCTFIANIFIFRNIAAKQAALRKYKRYRLIYYLRKLHLHLPLAAYILKRYIFLSCGHFVPFFPPPFLFPQELSYFSPWSPPCKANFCNTADMECLSPALNSLPWLLCTVTA